jgi:hypothetical protein
MRSLPTRPLPRTARRAAAALVVAFALAFAAPNAARPAAGAELAGVTMPDTLQAAGTPLRLNGMGLRTYSMFLIHIYVAALYLERPSRDAEAILGSTFTKLVIVHFLHDVGAERARDAWANGFRENCRAPCRLPAEGVERFLAAMPEFHRGDESSLLFSGHTVTISVNGGVLGSVTDPDFTRTILAAFIGAAPPSEPFKHALLGIGD